RESKLPCIAVAFDTPAAECRDRNRNRPHRIPTAALAAQLRAWAQTRELLREEGYDQLLAPEPVRLVRATFAGAREAVRRQQEQPAGLRFGLQIGSYGAEGGPRRLRPELRRIATEAEEAGFHALYVMDHFRQIPQAGRAWDDFLESYTALAHLSAWT